MENEIKKKRCVIYTRKSVDDGLAEQEFNSLDAQREAAEAYITSQKANGWVCDPKHYDDGGFSGGNINRPALQELLKECEAGKVDVIVVYKIDRLSRSILDFSEIMKKFDEHNVQFVSVTQEINTASSAGRMMLNILMTFAQYEREIISERTRFKMEASRKRGMFVGGCVVLGYINQNKKLIPVPAEAEVVNRIFNRYIEIQSPRLIAEELNNDGILTKRQKKWTPAAVYRILTCHTYIGEVYYHAETICKGEHEAIVPRETWDRVQEIMKMNQPFDASQKRAKILSPLRGILYCGHCGGAMMPTYGRRKGKRYFYYLCSRDQQKIDRDCPVHSITAGVIEKIVREQMKKMLFTPDFLVILAQTTGLAVSVISELFKEEFWDHMTPGEMSRIFHLLLERVTVYEDQVKIELRSAGMKHLIEEFKKYA